MSTPSDGFLFLTVGLVVIEAWLLVGIVFLLLICVVRWVQEMWLSIEGPVPEEVETEQEPVTIKAPTEPPSRDAIIREIIEDFEAEMAEAAKLAPGSDLRDILEAKTHGGRRRACRAFSDTIPA